MGVMSHFLLNVTEGRIPIMTQIEDIEREK